MFVISNILLISSPPALTLAQVRAPFPFGLGRDVHDFVTPQITQAASGDAFERLISRTIFWAYCILTPPATIVYVVIGLYFAER